MHMTARPQNLSCRPAASHFLTRQTATSLHPMKDSGDTSCASFVQRAVLLAFTGLCSGVRSPVNAVEIHSG